MNLYIELSFTGLTKIFSNVQKSKDCNSCFDCASDDRVWWSKRQFALRLHRKVSKESNLIKCIQIAKRSATCASGAGPRDQR